MVKGIVRNLDHLGRVTIPKEMRKSLMINVNDPVDIYFNRGVICIEPCRLQCVMCGNTEDKCQLVSRNDVLVCTDCIEELSTHIDRSEPDKEVVE